MKQSFSRRTRLFALLLFFWLLGSPSLFAGEEEFLDTWVKPLNKQDWPNGQYRYLVLSFWKENGQLRYFRFTVYPTKDIRSQLILGTAKLEQGGVVLNAKQRIRVLNKGKGFPTPFGVESTLYEDAMQRATISIRDSQLQFNQLSLVSYQSEWQRALREKDAGLGMDLTILNIFLLHNRMKYFGTVKMSRYKNAEKTGFVSGRVSLNFEARGLLGLGNSGILFGFERLEQLHNVKLDGDLFAGQLNMERSVNIFLAEKNVLSVRADKVKIKQGYAAAGYYLVRFPGSEEKKISVGRYGY